MTSKTKYIVIVLLLLVLATTSVGLSTWNIHYQAIVGDIDFTMQDPSTKDSVLNRYIYFDHVKDANGNITATPEKVEDYPISRSDKEEIFTYVYDGNAHTPAVFVPSAENIKGDTISTDLFLADGALDLNWGITNVFDEIEFKYEYRLIAMPYVSEDYKGKSENFCEITAIEYYENRINVYLTWKNGNNGNNQGENVLVELLLSGENYTNFNIPNVEDENIKNKITVTNADGQLTVGVNGFTPFPIVTAQNGWVTYAPSNAGVYQCRITAQLKDGASGNIDTANKAIAQLNSLDEGEINYAAQVTYAILPRNSEMAQIGYSYEKSSATEQQIKARRNLANTMPLAESTEVTNDEDGLHDINGNSNSFYVTYGGVGFEISITSTFATLDGIDDVSFPISEYLFTNANALKELLADDQTWDQNENHYYTTYGFSPDPNYQITNPEVHYTILRREISIDSWTTTDLVYNGTAQSPIASATKQYDAVFEYSWTKADGTELDSAPIDAGSYKVLASVGENYYLSCVEGAGTLDEASGKVSFDYTIAPKPVDITWTNTDTLVYNGSAQAPTATANGLCTRDGAVDLCTVTVTGAKTNAGTGYTATATALSNPNYVLATKEGGWTTTFKINPKPVNIVWSNTTLTYNGQAQTPTATVATGELCAGDACTVTVTANVESIDVGDYTAKATSLSNTNYVLAEGTWETAFKITPKPVTITWTTDTLVYNGTAQAPTATVEGLVGGDTCTVDVTGKETNAGTGYTATATGLSNNNYKFADDATLTTSFTINKLTATLSWSNLVSEYDGKTHLPTATVSNLCGTDTCTVTVTGEQTNAGTHTATATGLSNGNYALPTNATQKFVISPKSITLTWSDATLTYNGTAQAPTASIASGLVNGDTCDVTITGQQTIVGSNYTATATLVNTNYTATNSTQAFEITQLEIGINWSNVFFTYDGTSHAPTATATGLVGGDTVTITVDGAQTNANATGETYTATATGLDNGNYKLPENATTTFTIEQKTIGINWTNTTLEYDGTPRKPTATATGLVGGDTCTVTVTTDGDCINVGTGYTATANSIAGASAGNYKLPETKPTTTFAITAKPVTITWAGTTLTYNGNTQKPTATVNGVIDGDTIDVTVTTNGDCINAGNYTAEATLAGDKSVNYTITSGSTTTFTINKAPNAIVWGEGMVIDAENNVLVGWTYGSEPIAHTATAAQGGNVAITYYTTYNATTGECSGEFTPSSTTSAGTYYAKAVSQDSGSNYHGTSIVMSFAVTPATLVGATVTLQNHENLVYDGTEKTVAIKSVVLANGTVLTAYNVTGLKATNAGTYTVTVTVPNYEGSATATFEIAKGTYDMSGITFDDVTVEYTGSPVNISISGTLPTGVSVSYVGNGITDVSSVTVTANFTTTDSNYNTPASMTATLTITPKKIAKPAVPEGTTFTYNGEDQLEAILAIVGYNSSTMTYDAGNGRISFVNAGSNKEIKFTPLSNYCWADDNTTDTISVFVSIAKAKVRVVDMVIEFDYNSNGVSWDSIAANVTATTSVVSGTKLVGTIQYTNTTNDTLTTLTTGSSIKVGSTYKIVYTVASSTNIEFVGKNYCYLKYKTAKIDGTDGYYTIEDALATSGTSTITFEGNSSSATSYIHTMFSLIQDGTVPELSNITLNYTLTGGRTLIVPYENSTTVKVQDGQKSSMQSSNVYSALTIPDGVKLTIPSNAKLYVGSRIYYKQPQTTVTGIHGVLVNNGTINVLSGGTIESYGYLKGTGALNLESGSTTTDCLHTYDWPGGSAASSMYQDVFPANAWSFHNISCPTKIYAGATYKTFLYSTMSGLGQTITIADSATVIGNGSSTNCLFQPDSNSSRTDSYIFKYAQNSATNSSSTALTEITGSNQIAGQKDIFEMHGDYVDCQFSFSVRAALVFNVALTTSPSISMPIGYMDVHIKSNGNVSLSNSDYLFLPGTKLVIDEGSTVTTASGIDVNFMTIAHLETLAKSNYCFNQHCVDRVDSYAVVNGSFVINGGISGEIRAGSANAFLDLSNAKASSTYKIFHLTDSPYYAEFTNTATGTITDGVDVELKTFTAGTSSVDSIYVATSDGSDGYIWTVTQEEALSYTITTVWSTGESNTTTYRYFASDGTPEITPSTLGDLSKDYYDFDGWYTDSGHTTAFTSTQTVASGGTYTYYAKFSPITYNVTYTLYSDTCGGTELDTSTLTGFTNSSTTTYSAESALVLAKAVCGEMVFDGWYILNPLTNEYVKLAESGTIGTAGTEFGGYTLGKDLTDFELVGTLKNLQKFTVTYKAQTTADSTEWAPVRTDADVVEGTVVDYASILSELFDNNTYNYNSSYKHYFDTSQWYTDQACTTKFEPPADGIASNLILYAKRSNKDSVTVTYSSKNSSGTNVTSTATYYRNPGGGTATVPLGNPSTHGGVNTYYTDASDGTYKSAWTYDYWTYGSSTATNTADISTNTTFTAHYTETKYWKVTLIASGRGWSGAAKLTYSYTGFDADGNFGTYSNKTVTGGLWTTNDVIIYANVKPEVTVNVGSKTESGALTSGTLTIKVTA